MSNESNESTEDAVAKINFGRLVEPVVALRWAEENMEDLARVTAEAAIEVGAYPAAPAACMALAEDAAFARVVRDKLDPMIELPEPFDTVVDGVVFFVALTSAGAARLAARARARANKPSDLETVKKTVFRRMVKLVPAHRRAAERRVLLHAKANEIDPKMLASVFDDAEAKIAAAS